MTDPRALISTNLERLSMENIANVWNKLASRGDLSRPMEQCLNYALLKFSRETSCLQENAQLVIHCEGQRLEFSSGTRQSKIEVTYTQGVPCYQVQLPSFDNTVEMSSSGILVLDLGNLDRVMAKMISWREMTKGLKSCLEKAKHDFSREPQCIQDNAKMVVKSDGRVLEFISGDGINTSHVFQQEDGTIHYIAEMLRPREKLARSFMMPVDN